MTAKTLFAYSINTQRLEEHKYRNMTESAFALSGRVCLRVCVRVRVNKVNFPLLDFFLYFNRRQIMLFSFYSG